MVYHGDLFLSLLDQMKTGAHALAPYLHDYIDMAIVEIHAYKFRWEFLQFLVTCADFLKYLDESSMLESHSFALINSPTNEHAYAVQQACEAKCDSLSAEGRFIMFSGASPSDSAASTPEP